MTPTETALQLIQQHGPAAFNLATANFEKHSVEASKPYTSAGHDELLKAMQLSSFWFSVVTTIFHSNN